MYNKITQTCLNMYNNGILPEWNVSVMFPDLQKSKATMINIMISELDYILICMTGASQNILTDAQSGYCETPGQHIWLLFSFFIHQRKEARKKKKKGSFNLGDSTTELSGIPDCGGPPGMHGTKLTTTTHNTLVLWITNNQYIPITLDICGLCDGLTINAQNNTSHSFIYHVVIHAYI